MRYIGITGIVTEDDALVACDAAAMVPEGWRLMAGVLVSYKSLGGTRIESRRYPTLDQATFRCAELARYGCWPVLHYNSPSRAMVLREEIEELFHWVPAARGLQLNVAQPDPDTFAWVRRTYPRVETILQVNRTALNHAADVEALVDAFPAAHHALLDLSGGRGTGVDAEWAIRRLYAWNRETSPGIAGGLGPGCAPLLRRIRHAVNGRAFSVDAESQLRVPVEDPTPGAKHQDRLDADKALAYVRDAVEGLVGGG